MKYAIYIAALVLAVCGIYYSGYVSGANNAKIKQITKEVEVVKYVSKEKANIYSKPSVTRDGALQLFYDSKL